MAIPPPSRTRRGPPPPIALHPPRSSRSGSTSNSGPPSSLSSHFLASVPAAASAAAYADVVPIVPKPSQHKSHAAQKSPNHTKRPPNSWILYRSDTLRNIERARKEGREFVVPEQVRNHPRWADLGEGGSGSGMPSAQSKASKLISLMWSLESKEVKGKFERLSEIRKLEHAQQFPDYKFQPKRPAAKTSNSAPSVLVSSPPSPQATAPSTRVKSSRPSSSIDLSIPPGQPPFARRVARPPPPPLPLNHPPPHPYAPFGFYNLDGAQSKTDFGGAVRSERTSQRRKKRCSKRSDVDSLGPFEYEDVVRYPAVTAYNGGRSFEYDPALVQQSADISWAVPPAASDQAAWAQQTAFHAQQQDVHVQGLGLGEVGGEDDSGYWGQHTVSQEAYYPAEPGPSSYYVSPSVSSDSFDSHPTPLSFSHTPLRDPAGDVVYPLEKLSPQDVAYEQYEFTNPWPNPIESCEPVYAVEESRGPAAIIRYHFLDDRAQEPYPTAPKALSAKEGKCGQRVTAYADFASQPGGDWQPAALDLAALGGAMTGSVPDSDGLAAMWCLLDDAPSSTAGSPFGWDAADGLVSPSAAGGGGDAGHEVNPFALSFDAFGEDDSAGKVDAAIAGVDGDWQIDYTVDYSLPAPERATLDLSASGMLYAWDAFEKPVADEVGVGVAEGEDGDEYGWEGADDAVARFERANADRSRSPSAPAESVSRAEDAQEVESMTAEVERCSVGIPRRNTRVVGGSFRPAAAADTRTAMLVGSAE